MRYLRTVPIRNQRAPNLGTFRPLDIAHLRIMPSSPSRESIIHSHPVFTFAGRVASRWRRNRYPFGPSLAKLPSPRQLPRGSRAIRDSALFPNRTPARRDFIPAFSRKHRARENIAMPLLRGEKERQLGICGCTSGPLFLRLVYRGPAGVRPRAITTTSASRSYGMWAELDKQRALA